MTSLPYFQVKSVEMGGRDKLVETELSEMTIVLIGMGSTFGLLLLIVIIVLVNFYFILF